MSSLDILATIQKNGVIGVNDITNRLRFNAGTNTSVTITTSTLIVTGSGRLVNVSVVAAGTTPGVIYNFNSTASVPVSSAMAAAPNTLGVYPLGQVFTSGLVVVPGTGQSLNITYSPGA
jgi:hypothetical protein